MKTLLLGITILFSSFIYSQVNFSAGYFHSSSVCADGTAQSWGYDCDGRLGVGSPGSEIFATLVDNNQHIVNVSAGGYHTLFLMNDSTVWSTGKNNNGQLGFISSNISTPQQIPGLDSIVAISAGRLHSIFLKADGTVWACGRYQSNPIVTGNYQDVFNPIEVLGLSNISKISAGNGFSLYLNYNGDVYGSGSWGAGQLGNDTLNPNTMHYVVPVLYMDSIIDISAGEKHSLFLRSDGKVFSCGDNWGGPLGDGTTNDRDIAEEIIGIDSVTQIEAGTGKSFFIRSDGTVWVCGEYVKTFVDSTQGGHQLVPGQMNHLENIIDMSASGVHYLFLQEDSTLVACGDNHNGKLGDGTTIFSYEPVEVLGLCGDQIPWGVENLINAEFLIYPNPSIGAISISLPEGVIADRFDVIDLTGRLIESGELKDHITLKVPSGTYMIQLFDGELKIGSKRLVIE